MLEAERGVPRLEFGRTLEEADDLAVLGIRGHPVPESRREGRRAGFDDRMEPLAQARSGFAIAAICASTALSPSALSTRGPRRPSAFSSWSRSRIATRSSSVNPWDVLPIALVLLADFRVPFFAVISRSFDAPDAIRAGRSPLARPHQVERLPRLRGSIGYRPCDFARFRRTCDYPTGLHRYYRAGIGDTMTEPADATTTRVEFGRALSLSNSCAPERPPHRKPTGNPSAAQRLCDAHSSSSFHCIGTGYASIWD